MGSKKNNKNSPVFDAASPIEPITPPLSKAQARPSANVNAKSKKSDNDPTV